MSPVLEVSGLQVGYRDLAVVHGIDLDAAAGEVVGVTGRNGAGKTTLLNAVAGLLSASAGSVRVDGVEVSTWSPWRRARAGLALVPEGKRVIREISVQDNLRLGMFARRGSRAETAVRIDSALDVFPALRDRLGESASQLSGGQQQMLAIAQALMSRPRVLLVDEPSSGLSPKLVEEVLQAFRALADGGVAVVVVEQQIDGIAAVSDQIVVVDGGRVAWSGAASEPALYEKTRDIYFGATEVSLGEPGAGSIITS